MIGAILEQAQGILLDGQALVITFEKENEVVADRLRNPETIELLRQTAERITGGPVNIRVESGETAATVAEEPPPTGELAAPPEPRAPESVATKTPRGAQPGRSELLEQARKEPGVKKLLREFGAQVVDIRPLEVRAPEPATDVEDQE